LDPRGEPRVDAPGKHSECLDGRPYTDNKRYSAILATMSDTDSSDSILSTPEWFTRFDQFTYNSNAGIRSNFTRLALARQWGTRLRMSRWIECQSTVFDSLYGTDATKLEIWQELCREVHVVEVPGSINGCKKVSILFVFRSTHTDTLHRHLEVAKSLSTSSTSLTTA
jgi:hypothetical protein